MRRYKAAILGYYGFGNLGDELLLQSCIDILGRHGISREEIIVLSNSPKETSESFHVASCNRWKIRDVIHAFMMSDSLVLGGGGLFQDVTSVKSCVWYWGIVRLAKFLGCKIIAVGQSFGPLKSKLSLMLTRNALNSCSVIHVRDEPSYNIAVNSKCRRVILGSDIVMTLKPETTSHNHDDMPSCDDVHSETHSHNHDDMPSCDDVHVETHSRNHDDIPSCSDVRSETHTLNNNGYMLINLRPCPGLNEFVKIIMPHIEHARIKGAALSDEDIEPLKMIMNREDIVRVKSFHEAQTLWQGAYSALGMRLHFGVLSRIFGVPLALMPYDVKVSEFARQSGVPCIIDSYHEPVMPRDIPEDVYAFDDVCSEII